jgi:hypothetical protein
MNLNPKVERDWFISDLIAQNQEVEFWDIGNFTRKNILDEPSMLTNYLVLVNNYQEFKRLVKANSDAIFVMLIPITFKSFRLYRKLSQLKCRMVYISWGAMPLLPAASRTQNVLNNFLSNPINYLKRMIQGKFILITQKTGFIRPFTLVFAAGNILKNSNYHAERIVEIDLCDLTNLVTANKHNSYISQLKFAVFLDTNLPYQSDIDLMGIPYVNAEKYYAALDNFFTYIEQSLKLEVRIAAHPKSTNKANFFDRKVSRYNTAELVRACEFVISHDSTSISYAILTLKPILFIYTEEMLEKYEKTVVQSIVSLSDYLNSKVINIDKESDYSGVKMTPPDIERYISYKGDFISSRAKQDELSPEIFRTELTKILSN